VRVRFVDLSHAIEDGMPGYPGLPSPRVGAILDHRQSRERYEGRAEFYLGRVEMSGNTGTYIDAPFHRFPDREDLSQVALARVAGLPGIVLDAAAAEPKARALELEADTGSLRGRAVLVRTGWDARWGTDAYWEPGPYLSADSVDRLAAAGAALVGVDFWNVDDTTDPSRPAHTRLLAAGVLIIEHLCGLDALPASGFRFFAVPPRLVRGASFPLRAFAELPE
jgi:kynurenine formamidase